MKPVGLITLKNPKSPASEVYRTLRTNIKFASFEKNIRTIAITSAGPSEGKSTITCNLGITMAQSGSRVLIAEGDLRNPSVHKNFAASNSTGLTNILTEDSHYSNHVIHTEVDNLDIITCGPKPPNPSELLGSPKMKNLLENLKNDYDYILMDTTPVVAVTDGALLASICDGTILTVSSGETIIEGAVRAKELLQSVHANILGIVLNKVKSTGAGGYYKYYHCYENNNKEN